MNVYIENETNEYFHFRGYKKLIAQTIDKTAEIMQLPSGLDVNVMIVEPDTIRQINRDTRDTDRVTDVLSFPYFEYAKPGDVSVLDTEDPETILGDIVLCADKVIAQAEEYGHSEKRELAWLVVHSMLHLLGYDHMTQEEETLMTAQAESIMDALGIGR